MKSEYKRDINGNYLVLYENEEPDTSSYQMRMLVGNSIPSILKCRVQGVDGQFMVCYDITSKQSLLSLYEEKKMGYEDLQMILGGFVQAEKEVTDLHKRISQGIQTTKEKNQLLPPEEQKQIGRRTGVSVRTKKSVEMKNRILKMSKCFSGNMSDKECMEILQIARNTFYKYKRELLAEMESVGSTVE